jgi:NAD(P)-dependent dehydrogenase (short-subunit alcohol dehydrogenase family)
MRNLSQRTYLVSGAVSGMGRELVLELFKKGAHIAAASINRDSLEETFKLANLTLYKNTDLDKLMP